MLNRSGKISTFAGAALALTLLQTQHLSSATFEQIQANCREQASPQVKSCIQASKGGGASIESVREKCRSAASATVKACIQRETQRATVNKAAPAAPTAATDAGPPVDVSKVTTAFVAPPRTISDITAILDAEKPDPDKIARFKAEADASPPKGLTGSKLAQFLYDRGNARSLLARNEEALADGLKALEAARGGDRKQINRIRQFLAIVQVQAGDQQAAIATLKDMLREAQKGGQINPARNLVDIMISIGDGAQADAYARRVAGLVKEARGSPHPAWRSTHPIYKNSWEADADGARAAVLEMRGQYREAEAGYQRANAFRLASLADIAKFDFPPPPEQIQYSADRFLLSAAEMKARQGLIVQAEADGRRALLNVLGYYGKYHPRTPRFIVGLADTLIEQGRFDEAEKLIRSAIEVLEKLLFPDSSPGSARSLARLGDVLMLQGKIDEAGKVFDRVEAAVADWPERARDVLLLKASRISAMYSAGRVPEGIAAAEQMLARNQKRVGERHIDTAAARGTLALGYALAGRDADAIREFKSTIPILLAAGGETAGDDDPTLVAARQQRLQTYVEAYIEVLARSSGAGGDIAEETFALADAVRGRSVQQALSASSARMVAKDPELTELVRREQDSGKQINAQLGALNNALALGSGERDESVIRAINATIDMLRAERGKARQEINRRFPAYAELIDPKAPTIDQIRSALRPGEALLSFYFGQKHSFVWAVPREGAVTFAALKISSIELEASVRRLRAALEPQAETIDEIPAFDLELAHELYQKLLEPVAAGWRSSRSLIVVTNGAIGLLPLSLLPTALPSADVAHSIPFAVYRAVPWLARTHAVSQVPSVSALRTLRQLPGGSAGREPLVGFGDPFFNSEQALEAQTAGGGAVVATAMRGIPFKRRAAPKTSGVDSAELGLLPRLPDTADELRSIALALEVDPSRALFLGKKANEQLVKATDLSKFKIVAFATHGLVPGELNGLTQPALALSAPAVADSDGDGLLTMEEILPLKLDADWVVLSACNTGTGAGAGAEAASGLGRAFFYAGTRALLVTNWAVHSASARELVTELFRIQAKEPDVSRAQALRKAMSRMIDEGGWTDDQGKMLFSYAHPLFWAPYTIIGDGGRS